MELRHCHCQAQPTQPAPSLITMSCKQSLIETHVTDKRCTRCILYIYIYIITIHNSTKGHWCKLIQANIHMKNAKRIQCKWDVLCLLARHSISQVQYLLPVPFTMLGPCDMYPYTSTNLQKKHHPTSGAISHLSLPQKWQSTQFSPQFLQHFTNGNSTRHGLNFSHLKPLKHHHHRVCQEP